MLLTFCCGKLSLGDYMKKIDALLFDLDGTLIDSNAIIVASYRHAYKVHLPNLTISDDEIIQDIGPTLYEIFNRYTDNTSLVDKLITTYRNYYTENEKKYHSLYPKVTETLQQLKSMNIPMAIVTSKFKEAAWPSFTFYHLDQYFNTFVALEDVINPKPHKEPILKALNHLGFPKNPLMIGDNKSDILAAKNAGILSAGVAWSIKGIDHLKEAHPDFIFNSMHDIIKLVKY